MAPFDIEALTGRHSPAINRKESWSIVIGYDLTSHGWRLPLNSRWNNGMPEKWNIGYKKADDVLISISEECRRYIKRYIKIDLIPAEIQYFYPVKSFYHISPGPAFQYSSTPGQSIAAKPFVPDLTRGTMFSVFEYAFHVMPRIICQYFFSWIKLT
jgi:hypothetical protein